MGKQVVLQTPGRRYALRMLAAGNAPVTTLCCNAMVQIRVDDERVAAELSRSPALVGKIHALAPAAGGAYGDIVR